MEPKEPYGQERPKADPNQWFRPTGWRPPAGHVRPPTPLQQSQQPTFGTLPQPPYQPPNAPVMPIEKPRSRGKKILLVVAIITGLAIAVAAALFVYMRMSASGLADAMLVSDRMRTSMIDQDAKTAYTLVTDQFKSETTQEQLQLIFEQIGPLLDGAPQSNTSNIQKSDDGTTRAVVVYETSGSAGKTYYLRIVLEENSNEWQVLNFRTDDEPLDVVIE